MAENITITVRLRLLSSLSARTRRDLYMHNTTKFQTYIL
jgi:hypothetical protein